MMFIHRDDADPAKKGLADLIVAKHRNGPTDTVPLTFLPHLTQFRNAARDRPRDRDRLRARRRVRVRAIHAGSSGTSGRSTPPRRADPLDELILTVLSQHTSDLNAERAFGRSCGPRSRRWDDVVVARRRPSSPTRSARAGSPTRRPPRIQAILREIHEREGALRPVARSRRMSDAEAREYLIVAPRRRAEDRGGRAGLRARPRHDPGRHARASGGDAPRADPAEDVAPSAPIGCCTSSCPTELRTPLHVGLIRLGREICKARRAPVRGLPAEGAVPDGAVGYLRNGRRGRAQAPRTGIEPRAGEGNRTPVSSLGSLRSAIEPHPRASDLAGASRSPV